MERRRRIVIAGGTGFIGRALASYLNSADCEVVVLTRGASESRGVIRRVRWDGKTLDGWIAELDGAAAVVNLAGSSINCRFTAPNRRKILDSRVDSTRALVNAIARTVTPPRALVQASGIGYYGSSGARVVDENARPGSDFMADVCRQWEDALHATAPPATRKVILRIGIVLGRGGGALAVLERLTKAYLAGAAGNGGQFVSWIHLDDLIRVIVAALERDDLSGVYNATAPNPVTNAELMRELRRALHRPWSPPVPAPLVHLGGWLMGTEGQLALQSIRVFPQRLLDAGFTFRYPHLRDALRDLYELGA
jgi:uncharacterized protein